LPSGKAVRSFHGTNPALSASGERLVTAWEKQVFLWDARTGRRLHTFAGHEDEVTSCAFSRDATVIATSSRDATVHLWDAAAGKRTGTLEGHFGTVRKVAWSPDGNWIATASEDGTARFWDAKSRKEVRKFLGHTGPVHSVSFSADARWLVSVGFDSTVRVWEVATGKEKRSFKYKGAQNAMRDAVSSSDGQWVVYSDGTARLWKVGGKRPSAPSRGPALAGRNHCSSAEMTGGCWSSATPTSAFSRPRPGNSSARCRGMA
jgi:WD40 repeat protein